MVAQKKKTTKKTNQKVALKKAPVEKIVPAVAENPKNTKKEKTYVVSSFFYKLTVIMVAILYIELAAILVVHFYYDVTIISNAKLAERRAWMNDPRRIEMLKKFADVEVLSRTRRLSQKVETSNLQ